MAYLNIPGFCVPERTEAHCEGYPVIVARNDLVLDATPEVWANRVEEGMPVADAVRLCAAVVVQENGAEMRERFQQVWDIALSHTPLVETEDWHKGLLDLTGCPADGETLTERAETIRQQIHGATGLTPIIGGGSTRFDARIACRTDFVPRVLSEERRRRDGMDIADAIPVTPKRLKHLRRLGLLTLGHARRMSLDRLLKLVGRRDGWRLHRMAHGHEVEPIVANYPLRSVTETVAFPPLDHEPAVMAQLNRLCENANAQLRDRAEYPTEIELILRKWNGETLTGEMQLARDGVNAFGRACRVERLIRETWDGEELDGMTLRFGGLSPPKTEQQRLWESGRRRQREFIARATSMIHARFGADKLTTPNDESLSALRPRFAEEVMIPARLCPQWAGW